MSIGILSTCLHKSTEFLLINVNFFQLLYYRIALTKYVAITQFKYMANSCIHFTWENQSREQGYTYFKYTLNTLQEYG